MKKVFMQNMRRRGKKDVNRKLHQRPHDNRIAVLRKRCLGVWLHVLELSSTPGPEWDKARYEISEVIRERGTG